MNLAATLVVVLYTLVPEGRWRQRGKLAAAGVVTLAGLARVALGAEAPTDVLVGAAIGVAIPLALFRRFAPNAVFPISYRRGRAAHLDVTGARGAAIRRGLEDQLGLAVTEVKPFGLSGSAGSTPLRITVKGVDGEEPTQLFGKLYAQSHLRADRWYKLGRELLYGRLEDEKPFNTVRRLVQQEDYALRLCRDAGLPTPRPQGQADQAAESSRDTVAGVGSEETARYSPRSRWRALASARNWRWAVRHDRWSRPAAPPSRSGPRLRPCHGHQQVHRNRHDHHADAGILGLGHTCVIVLGRRPAAPPTQHCPEQLFIVREPCRVRALVRVVAGCVGCCGPCSRPRRRRRTTPAGSLPTRTP
jgi:hypothetical protein